MSKIVIPKNKYYLNKRNEYITTIRLGVIDLSKIIDRLSIELESKEQEIERLKQGYCPIKEKCNKGECDCTNEEYNQMCEENTKLDLEIERLNNIIKEVRELLEKIYKILPGAYNQLLIKIKKELEILDN